MAAYDQGFPATASNGSVVQVGGRLYTWTLAANRWMPSGPVPVIVNWLTLVPGAVSLLGMQTSVVQHQAFR